MNTQTPVKNIKFSSVPESISTVEQFIEEVCTAYSVGDEVFGNILISVTEAANNAIYHGNKSDRSKQVEMSCLFLESKRTLVFTIKDEGAGFDYENLPDPTAPENLEKSSGRGVFLMKQLADMISFSNGGNTIEMHFKI